MRWSIKNKLMFSMLVVTSITAYAQDRKQDFSYEECNSKSYFCCEINEKVVGIAKPENILGTYNFESALNYCEKKYGATVSVDGNEFIQVPEKSEQDLLEDLDNSFLEID